MTQRLAFARLAIVAQLVFIAGWAVLGLLEGHGYQPGRDDISDLSALTAHHAIAARLWTGLTGAATIAFVAVALVPLLGRRAWLVAASLPALDNLSDAFFRLDCRAADAGCTTGDALSSWHARVHLAVFVVAAVCTVAAPFALRRALLERAEWADLGHRARSFGVVVVAVLVLTGVTSGTALQGWTQRLATVVVCTGIVVLAARVASLSRVRQLAT